MKRVLITGADSFTGKYLTNLLIEAGYDVAGTTFKSCHDGHFEYLDITDLDAIKVLLAKFVPDYIVHLSAISFVADSNYKLFYDVNLFGSLNLISAISELRIPVKKIIMASSANVYGNCPRTTVIDEDSIPKPVNHYAMSKFAMENLCLQYSDLPILITRPLNYTGPGQHIKFLVPKIVEHFRNKSKTIELGNIDIYRDFSDVRDIARYYLGLIESDSNSGVFNLCSGSVYSVRDIIDMLESISEHRIEVKVNPMFVRENEIKRLSSSVEKLRNEINIYPKYSLKQTLEYMYYKESEE